MGLREDILNNAALASLVAARNDAEIARRLSEGRTKIAPRQVSARTILAELPISGEVQGATVLDKLEAAGASIPACKWAMRFLLLETGLDVGHPNTQVMLDVLSSPQVGVLTPEEALALKELARVPDPIDTAAVSAALNAEG